MKARAARDMSLIGEYAMSVPTEKEIVSPVNLCDDSGLLNRAAVGWSRVPLQKGNLKGAFLRKKRWDYWCITSDEFIFSLTIANVDYVGLCSFYIIDCAKKEMYEKTVATPFGAGVEQGELVDSPARFSWGRSSASFVHDPSSIHMKAFMPGHKLGDFSCDLTISKPAGHETLNVVVPWDDRRFQFTSKQNTMPASGKVTLGGMSIEFDASKSFACLDYGRGIWPYSISWNWGSCSGRSGSNIIGLNLGGKWTDGTGSTENGICLNGRLYKISEELVWEYDTKNFLAPWKIRTPLSKDLDLNFVPFFNRRGHTDAVVLKMCADQTFGRYFGTVRADGRDVPLDGVLGWAEHVVNRW